MKASIQLGRQLRIHLLFLILILLPTCAYSIQKHESDTSYVLVIYHYKHKPKIAQEETLSNWEKSDRASYLYPGATVDLSLVGNREILQGKILFIEKESLVIDRQRIYISEIREMRIGAEAKRRGAVFKGVLLLVLGLLAAGWWFNLNFILRYGDTNLFLKGLILPALVALGGTSILRKSGPRFNFQNPKTRLRAIPLTSLPARTQKKLARKFFIF